MPKARQKPTHAGICDECGVERVLKVDRDLPVHKDGGKPCSGVIPRAGTIVELTPEVMTRVAQNLKELRERGTRRRVA